MFLNDPLINLIVKIKKMGKHLNKAMLQDSTAREVWYLDQLIEIAIVMEKDINSLIQGLKNQKNETEKKKRIKHWIASNINDGGDLWNVIEISI